MRFFLIAASLCLVQSFLANQSLACSLVQEPVDNSIMTYSVCEAKYVSAPYEKDSIIPLHYEIVISNEFARETCKDLGEGWFITSSQPHLAQLPHDKFQTTYTAQCAHLVTASPCQLGSLGLCSMATSDRSPASAFDSESEEEND